VADVDVKVRDGSAPSAAKTGTAVVVAKVCHSVLFHVKMETLVSAIQLLLIQDQTQRLRREGRAKICLQQTKNEGGGRKSPAMGDFCKVFYYWSLGLMLLRNDGYGSVLMQTRPMVDLQTPYIWYIVKLCEHATRAALSCCCWCSRL
jgi:hypothetical protein